MTALLPAEQIEVRCVLMRGGTSKGLYFHLGDLPAPGAERDRLLKRAMGSPDILQIDGLGGSRLVTSKIAIISRSARPDADVDYTFAQVDVERDLIGYEGNCGNISSGVGPFAIDEGLVAAVEPVTTVRIYNTNTDKLLVARVPVAGGRARVLGDCVVPGVPGSGAEILMDYSGTVGAKTGRLLPTGNPTDVVTLPDGRAITVSVVDVANPCVFIAARSLGYDGSELPEQISADTALIEILSTIQVDVGRRIGLYAPSQAVHRPGLPLAVLVAPPADYVDANGERHVGTSMDLRARLVFLGKCHDSMAGTGSMCTAAASRVVGTVVHTAVTGHGARDTLRIGHPLGVMAVKVIADPADDPARTGFAALGLTRTARRLMAGALYVPAAPTRNL